MIISMVYPVTLLTSSLFQISVFIIRRFDVLQVSKNFILCFSGLEPRRSLLPFLLFFFNESISVFFKMLIEMIAMAAAS